MNITKITVARLYNLGNYEHVRYELTAEIKEGESATTAIKGLESIVGGLKPLEKCGICSASEIDRKRREVDEMRKMPVAEWGRRYGHCVGTPSEVIQRYELSLKEEEDKREEATRRASEARELMDDLGGAAEWSDAKLSWEDDL